MKKTPLYEAHVRLGAKMVPFAGYQMPVQYKGIIEEHHAVRDNMGIFDVSHMGEIEIHGEAAVAFCQRVSSNDVTTLKPGKVQYSTILNQEGGIIDDCTLYCIDDQRFIFVVNASRKDEVLNWFEKHPMDGAELIDRSESTALFALQGPKCETFLGAFLDFDLSSVKYYECKKWERDGRSILISRTGYTGENGFELYIPTAQAVSLWEELLEVGKEKGLMPIGLGARDTLRLEMGYMLYGSDMDTSVTPYEAGLGWVVKLEKGEFFGRKALKNRKSEGIKRRIRAIRMTGKGIPRPHYKVFANGSEVGEMTSGTFSPSLKTGIGMAFVSTDIKLGDQIDVEIRGKVHAGEIVKPPFVKGSIQK
jgi:aminomethyltransferase